MEEIFNELDEDQNGRISIAEFVGAYFRQQVQVEDRIAELEKLIKEDLKKRGEIVARLEEIHASEQVNEYGIMLNSVLTVGVIEGRGLRHSQPEIVLVMGIEGQRADTEPVMVRPGADPVWKEIITFEITTGREPLYL